MDRRHVRILAIVEERGSVRLSDLADAVGVSVVTIRRDVEQLAMAGQLERGHGVVQLSAGADRGGPSAVHDARTVGLLIPERHAYLNLAVEGARAMLERRGVRVALHLTPRIAHSELSLVDRIVGTVDGLLIAPRWQVAGDEDSYDWLADIPIPTMLMEREPGPASALQTMDSICSDHWFGARLAIDHLAERGHRRIVLAARDSSPTARTVRRAFTEIASADPRIDDWCVCLSSSSDHTEGDGNGGGEQGLVQSGRLPDLLDDRRTSAMLIHSDADALILVQQLTAQGVSVPGDCSVVAYDDTVASISATPLTAVAPPVREVGQVAVETLLARMDAKGRSWHTRRIELLPKLIDRGSAQMIV